MKDIAREADAVISSLSKDKWNNISLTTNQLRKFLAAVAAITNKVTVYRSKNPSATELSDELASEIKFLKVKAAYQAGRERNVREFIDKAKLINAIDSIGTDIKKFEEFAKYMEALVAYHKFYGGR